MPGAGAVDSMSDNAINGHQNSVPGATSGSGALSHHASSLAAAGASREVFQGLFQDLGKQAMAMEAILRLVCGKVDSMEGWMTEISFGMTELDLKLRNIAHNIEGTAANVDDEAANAHRWAAPPEPDSKASRVAATVKKKLGPNKTVKMTGMVASIIDTLGAPVEERDRPTKKKSLIAAIAVKKVHKKKTANHHSASQSESEARSAAANVDTAQVSLTTEGIAEVDGGGLSVTPGTTTAHDVDTTGAHDQATSTVPPLLEQQQEQATTSENDEVAVKSDLDSNRLVAEPDGGATHRGSEVALSLATEETSSPSLTRDPQTFTPARSPNRSGQCESERSTLEQPVPLSTGKEVERASERVEARAPAVTSQSPEDDQELSTNTTGPNALDGAHAAFDHAFTVNELTEPSSAETAAAQAPTENAPSSSGFLPSPTQSPTDVPGTSESTLAAMRSVPQLQATTPLDDSDTTAAPSSCSAPAAVEPTGVGFAANHSAPAPLLKKSSRKAAKGTTGAAGEQELRRKFSSRGKLQLGSKRSATALTESLQTTTQTPSPSANIAKVETPQTDQASVQSAPGDPQAHLLANTSTPTAQRQSDDSEHASASSESSASSASSSSSSLSDAESDSPNDDEHSGEEDAVASREPNKSGPNASSMTRTITALEKLKKANVLTAEEADELKDRAKEKWYKLKGHMKEKKKKDVANILLKRKKNVFTVSARIELLEEKSKEVFASMKQLAADVKTKVDFATNDAARRQVHDLHLGLQALDKRLTGGTAPMMEKLAQLAKEIDAVHSSFSHELVLTNEAMVGATREFTKASDEHRWQLESVSQSLQQQVATLRDEHEAKLRDLPDYTAALEDVKRVLRRKADLKQLKELEVRLLGHDVDSEDCLVRCLSCHKEVVSANSDVDAAADAANDDRSSYMKKVNPGPSAGKIYRSNVPFSAQLVGAYESIQEDSVHADADDLGAFERPATASTASTALLAPAAAKREDKRAGASAGAPIQSIQIKATRAAMSPDRPISAPVVTLKRKVPYVKSKPLLSAQPPPK